MSVLIRKPSEQQPKMNKSFMRLKKIKKRVIQNRTARRKNDKKPNIIFYLRDELKNLTTHGLSYTVDSRITSFERFFWLLSILVSIIILVILLDVQYTRFMEAPTVMSVEMNYFDWNISSPALTLCPHYKSDVMKLVNFINETYKATGFQAFSYFWAITTSSLDNLEHMDLSVPEDIKLLVDPKDYASIAASMFKKFQYNLFTTNNKWLLSNEPAMTEMGMCHVINSNVAVYDMPRKKDVPLPEYVKKSIDLSSYDIDFFTVFANYEDIYKIFIHSPDEISMSTTSSFLFDVEGALTFGLSVQTTRISDELRHTSLQLRKCRFTNEPISKRYPIYSHSHCIMECRIKMIQRLCGCVPHFYRTLDHERICYINELKCVLNHRKEIVKLSTLKETLKKFNHHKDLPTTSKDCGCLNTCELDLYYRDHEDFKQKSGIRIMKLRITSFPKVRFVRDIIFNFYDIILRIGGVVNLCIGSSIISLVEILLLIAKITIFFILKVIRVV